LPSAIGDGLSRSSERLRFGVAFCKRTRSPTNALASSMTDEISSGQRCKHHHDHKQCSQIGT